MMIAMMSSSLLVAAHADGDIVSRASYRLPAYDSMSPAMRREVDHAATRAAYDSARGDARFSLERVVYTSDGLKVVAYIAPAIGRSRDARSPAIVYLRGSYVMGDEAPVLAPAMHRLAAAGYTVVAPQYRGSDGGEGRDEMGGADVHDVLNAMHLARSLPIVDSAALFLYGESRGGMMVYQALRDGARVRAAAVVGAFTDLDSLLAGDARSAGAASQIWPDYAKQREQIAARRSAIRWADSIRAPVLILHGADDSQVSPRQSLRMAARLGELGRPYELHVIDGGNHTLSVRAAEREAEITAWFQRWR